MVLAIGLVVDDAIVVLENIHRHIEEGLKPVDAAIVGMKEIFGPIVSMTITLAAVYAPIGFTQGSDRRAVSANSPLRSPAPWSSPASSR